MATLTEVRVPDIGDFDEVPVIEILVAEGDHVDAEQALLTLESDKASMEIPAPSAGTIKEIKVSVGDTVSEGALIVTLEQAGENDSSTDDKATVAASAEVRQSTTNADGDEQRDDDAATQTSADESAGAANANQQADAEEPTAQGETQTIEVRVPDIGDFDKVPIVEIFVEVGASVAVDEALVTLESDKAAMDVPSPAAGKILSVEANIGDEVSEGDLLVTLQSVQAVVASSRDDDEDEKPAASNEASTDKAAKPHKPAQRREPPVAPVSKGSASQDKSKSHATPSVRRFARELGADLNDITGTGRKGRIVRDDVTRHIKDVMSGGGNKGVSSGAGIPTMPEIDFSKFGEVEARPLSRIKKLSGANLHRAWLVVPHATHHDDADITELERFRKSHSENAKQRGIRLTPLAFIMKACVKALQDHPTFNASLDAGGENLILKHYYHIGVAVDTPDGLMVPVVRDVDKKGIEALAAELGELSVRARDKKLTPTDLSGACFTISSLGGIGGTSFTPIVNAPEVAILGVSRSTMKPVYINEEFVPRLMLPLSLSYDHRVIDGAAAARFTRYLCELLTDLRRLLL